MDQTADLHWPTKSLWLQGPQMGESNPLGTQKLWVSLDLADLLVLTLAPQSKATRLKSLENMILLRNSKGLEIKPVPDVLPAWPNTDHSMMNGPKIQ